MSEKSATFTRASAAVAFGLVVLVVLLGADATRVAANTPSNRLTYFTFGRSVSLPGVTLPAGTYAFEVANPDSSGNIVLVRDRSRVRTYYTGLTHRTPRPANWSEQRQVVFGEAARGEVAPIVAWYPLDNAMGHEFIYRR